MIRISTLITACLIFSISFLQAQDYPLKLQSGTLNTIENTAAFASAEEPTDVVDGYYYRLLQFSAIPDQSMKARIEASGLVLLTYIPKNTFMTAIPSRYNRQQLSGFNVRSVVSLKDVQKINKNILGAFPEYCISEKGSADVTLQYMGNISHERALQLAAPSGKILASNPVNHVIDLRIPDNSLRALAAQTWVYYVSAIEAPSFPEDTKGRSLHRSNTVNSPLATGRKYDGKGVVAGLADDGLVGPHIDFTGRLFNFATGAGQTHGDMTSGILAGSGNLNPENRGMGSGAFLYVYNITGYPHVVDAEDNYTNLGTVITSTSYSQGCNEYTSDTQFGDNLLNTNKQISFVFSAGNNQAANCNYGAGAGWGNITGGYKQGKNVIAVANLDASEVLDPTSSRGPASDGRIKPDISANGRDQLSTNENNTYQVGGGTSAACPGIAGILTQLYQAYKELNGGVEPQAALMKACLLNSAEDIGNPGPDFTYGWGRVNVLRAVQTIEENRLMHDSISQGQIKTHTITVPAGANQVRVMVYWNDKAGTPLAATQLVNDLNITLDDNNGGSFNPWVLDATPTVASITAPAIRDIDFLNNMEQVTIDSPVAGNYTLTVNGFSIPFGVQEYFVVYEFRTNEITLTYPFGGESFVPGRPEVIRWDANKGAGSFSVEYSLDNGSTWTALSTSVNQNTQQFTWNIPISTPPTHEGLFRVTRGATTDVSDSTFRIIGVPTGLQVAWACPDSIRLTWNTVSGATGYTIYKLGTKYMEPIGSSTSNSFVVTNINPMTEHWFSVAAQINGFDGRRANAIMHSPGLANCILNTDAAIAAVTSPAAGNISNCRDNTAVNVTITFANSGANPLSNIPVSYSLNNGTPVTEVIPGPILAGAQLTYTFASTVNLTATGTYSLQTWSGLNNDQNYYNDSLTNSITVVSATTQQLPLTENFNAYNNCSTSSTCELVNCPTGVSWINEANGVIDDIDFRVASGATPSAGTGPDVDHTLGTTLGKYIYLEASSCLGRDAWLTASCIDLTTATQPQLTFWYHMYGATMGSLTVDVFSDGAWNNNVFPTVSGNKGNQWLQGSVNLSAYVSKVIDIRFRATTGNDFTSDLALDDISLTTSSSISEQSAYSNLRVFPNPSNGLFTLEMNSSKNETIALEITDAQGRVIRHENIRTGSLMQYSIDLQQEPKGIYFIRVNGAEGMRTMKITVM